jgi:hypothetical protein
MNILYKKLSKEPVAYQMQDSYECVGVGKNKAPRKLLYSKGAKVSGYPSLYKENGQNHKGLIFVEKNEFFIIPQQYIKQLDEKYSNLNGMDEGYTDAKEEIGEIAQDVEHELGTQYQNVKNIDPQKIFGFTWRQLLVIGVVGILVTKLVK